MEPITTTILAALAAGGAAAAQETTSTVIKDLYEGLKSLVKKRFAGKPEAETILAKHEKKPDSYKQPLEDELVEAGADKDEEIIRRATELIAALKKAGLGGPTLYGSGAIATSGGVAAGEGGNAAGRDIVINKG